MTDFYEFGSATFEQPCPNCHATVVCGPISVTVARPKGVTPLGFRVIVGLECPSCGQYIYAMNEAINKSVPMRFYRELWSAALDQADLAPFNSRKD